MKEVPLENNSEALRFAERLLAGDFDLVIFMTGVGTRYLLKVMESRYSQSSRIAALQSVVVVARGPKPTTVLRELGVRLDVIVKEPNTWREILAALEGRTERRIAIQEFGRPSTELSGALQLKRCNGDSGAGISVGTARRHRAAPRVGSATSRAGV
ncbi:MAG: uroporphyrinogen-III synthase [Bryobacteraceae bacterium]